MSRYCLKSFRFNMLYCDSPVVALGSGRPGYWYPPAANAKLRSLKEAKDYAKKHKIADPPQKAPASTILQTSTCINQVQKGRYSILRIFMWESLKIVILILFHLNDDCFF